MRRREKLTNQIKSRQIDERTWMSAEAEPEAVNEEKFCCFLFDSRSMAGGEVRENTSETRDRKLLVAGVGGESIRQPCVCYTIERESDYKNKPKHIKSFHGKMIAKFMASSKVGAGIYHGWEWEDGNNEWLSLCEGKKIPRISQLKFPCLPSTRQ
jgi:hypothetical protein